MIKHFHRKIFKNIKPLFFLNIKKIILKIFEN